MNLDEVRAVFQNDRYATEVTGINIEEAAPNYARCSLKITEKHLNAMSAVMGGAIFTLADFTFAVASNVDNMSTVGLTSQITYHATAKGQNLYAEAECVKSGRSTCFFIIRVSDDLDTLVATATMTGFRKG